MADPPKTRSQADACAARNQEQSPLLRLPGELRNKIYQHLFGDLIIEVVRVNVETHSGQDEIRLAVRKANSKDFIFTNLAMSRDTFQDCFESVRERVSITLASRQLHADTHLLLERSSLRFRGLLTRLPEICELIPPAQLNNISSVRLTSLEEPLHHLLQVRWGIGRHYRPFITRQQKWSILKQFPSLKQVIVEAYFPVADKAFVEEEIRDNAGKQDLKIVFE